MNEKKYFQYAMAYIKAIEDMSQIVNQHKKEEIDIRKLLHSEYKKRKLDPDGKAQRYEFDIKCTADGLLSVKRICDMENNVDDILPVYKKYRKNPIIFFPSENGGINTSRARIFGDRVDHTLYDIKLYYSAERNKCRLLNAYNKQKTKEWLRKMQSFENIVEWWGVKGIFTNEKYEVFDLESEIGELIIDYKEVKEYQMQWSRTYYNNLKKKIIMFNESHF